MHICVSSAQHKEGLLRGLIKKVRKIVVSIFRPNSAVTKQSRLNIVMEMLDFVALGQQHFFPSKMGIFYQILRY